MKFSPQIHLFLCLAMLGNMLAPALVRAEPQLSPVCKPINDPEDADEKTRAQNREKIFGNMKKSLGNRVPKHSELNRNPTQLNTMAGVRAQNDYFDYLTKTIHALCEEQNKIQIFVTRYMKRAPEKKSMDTCSGSFLVAEDLYDSSSKKLGEFNSKQEKILAELKKSYRQFAYKNKQNVMLFNEKPPELAALRQEFNAVWGGSFFDVTEKTLQQQGDGKFVVDRSSLFGHILHRVEQNKEYDKTLAEKMKKAREEMTAEREKCGPEEKIQDFGMHKRSESDIKGTPEERRATLASDDPSKVDPSKDDPSTSTNTNTYTDTTPPRNPNPPYVPTNTDPSTTQPPPKKEEESWLSENKGMLLTVGAGAAAVGGLLWYKNNQDKKAKKSAALLDAAAESALASSTDTSTSSSSSSTSTSTNTDSTVGGTPANGATPQGSKFVLSGLPTSATVNTTLPTITVSIINPSGILTQDSHTEIIVSCVQPAGCTLTGSGQAQTSAGKAKFSDLRFTSAHENVKLMFSSPGFNSVTSGSFNVTGGSGSTNTSTNTATSTSTSTSTSTNTGGNRE